MEKTNTSRHLLLFSQCWRCSLWTSIGPTCVHLCPPDTLCKQQSKCSQQVQGPGGSSHGAVRHLGRAGCGLPVTVKPSGCCEKQWWLLSSFCYDISTVCRDLKKRITYSILSSLTIIPPAQKKKYIGRKRWLVINTGSKNNHAGATKGAYSNTWSMLVSVIHKMLREGYKK